MDVAQVLSYPDGSITGLTETSDSDDGPVLPRIPASQEVTLTNPYDVGSLAITKVRTGAGAAWAAGPFEAAVACRIQMGGSWKSVGLPGGGKVTLTSDNRYRATIKGVLAGASCTVKETGSGGADSVALTPRDGTVTLAAGATASVVITNHFPSSASSGRYGPDGLPFTGSSPGPLVLLAIALMVPGVALRAAAHRRRRPS
jgi:hypothetical protein